MRVSRLIFFIYLSFIFLLPNANAAIKPILGISAIKIDSNNKDIKYVNNDEITLGLSYGLTANLNNIIIAAQTNRFIEITSSRSVFYKNNLFEDKTKIRNDNIAIGYRLGFIIPSLILSNVKVNKALYYKDKQVNYQTRNTLLHGANLGVILSKDNILNLFFIASSRELEITKAYGISFNHLF